MTEPFRITPSLPPDAMKTYSIRSPLATHTRAVTCAEVECDAYRHGWATIINLDATLSNGLTGIDQADYIRTAGRAFTETRVGDTLVSFTFPPGQRGFGHQHRVRLERPELFIVRPGDWRTTPRPDEIYHHTRPGDWVDDFATHQQAIADEIAKG